MTEITWPSPYGYTYFCDDIRHEVSGKLTLVGLYTADMTVVGATPAVIPKFTVGVQYFERPDEGHQSLELRVYLPGNSDDAPFQRIEIPERPSVPPDALRMPDPGDDPRVGLYLEMHMQNLVISEPGRIKVRMYRGEDIIRLGALTVKVISPEEAQAAGINPN